MPVLAPIPSQILRSSYDRTLQREGRGQKGQPRTKDTLRPEA